MQCVTNSLATENQEIKLVHKKGASFASMTQLGRSARGNTSAGWPLLVSAGVGTCLESCGILVPMH